MVELCEQLVHRGVILHANGTSIMPRALLDALLCESREQARTTELERLSNDARALGRMLSVLRSMGPKALVAVLADGDSAAIESQLAELERADVHVAATLADAGLGHEAEHWVRLHASDQLDESTQMLESTASVETASTRTTLSADRRHYVLQTLPAIGDHMHSLVACWCWRRAARRQPLPRLRMRGRRPAPAARRGTRGCERHARAL